jgi:hypothetical protein
MQWGLSGGARSLVLTLLRMNSLLTGKNTVDFLNLAAEDPG